MHIRFPESSTLLHPLTKNQIPGSFDPGHQSAFAGRSESACKNGASGRYLMVATSGGHVEEALRLRSRLFSYDQEVEWATHPQAQVQFPENEIVHRTPYIGPREARKALLQVPSALSLLKARRISGIVSTGAALALPFLIAGEILGLECHYIESAARADGPSLTGKLVSQLTHCQLYTQYSAWANKQWAFKGSIFDAYSYESIPARDKIDKIVVTLGTMQKYEFRRAIDAIQRSIAELGGSCPEILWQTGCTRVDNRGIKSYATIPAAELRAAVSEADLVIAHGGVGSALMSLDCGRAPLLLPRSSDFTEHVDGHQKWIAQELSRRSLAITCDPDSLSAKYMIAATTSRISLVPNLPRFELSTEQRARIKVAA